MLSLFPLFSSSFSSSSSFPSFSFFFFEEGGTARAVWGSRVYEKRANESLLAHRGKRIDLRPPGVPAPNRARGGIPTHGRQRVRRVVPPVCGRRPLLRHHDDRVPPSCLLDRPPRPVEVRRHADVEADLEESVCCLKPQRHYRAHYCVGPRCVEVNFVQGLEVHPGGVPEEVELRRHARRHSRGEGAQGAESELPLVEHPEGRKNTCQYLFVGPAGSAPSPTNLTV
eukprot:8114789-Pyramimonas_sp.AAC.2